jgi:hypothetical protein
MGNGHILPLIEKGWNMASPNVIRAAEMDFMDALRMVVNGEKITRVGWDNPNIYLLLHEGFLCIARNGLVSRLMVSSGDLMGVDWVVVQNHNTVKH